MTLFVKLGYLIFSSLVITTATSRRDNHLFQNQTSFNPGLAPRACYDICLWKSTGSRWMPVFTGMTNMIGLKASCNSKRRYWGTVQPGYTGDAFFLIKRLSFFQTQNRLFALLAATLRSLKFLSSRILLRINDGLE